MPQLRILIGYTTDHRRSPGTVLGSGPNLAALQGAIDAAPAEFLRFELGTFFYQRKGRRNAVVVASPEVVEEEQPESDGLDDLTIDELKVFADEEGIDVSTATLKQDYLDIIRLYRELDGAHKAEEIKALAHAEGVETKGLKTKHDHVNAVVAQRRAK